MMNSYIKNIIFAAFVMLALFGCDKRYKPSPEPDVVMAYIGEFLGTSTSSFSVEEVGGTGVITPRISSLINEPVTLSVNVDPAVLETYNKINKTNFTLLPLDNFDFYVDEKAGAVDKTKKQVALTFAGGNIGEKVQIKVYSMMKGGVKPDAVDAEPLPIFNNYAIPVRLVSTSVGEIQENAASGIFFLNRKFNSTVYYSSSGALTMVYKSEDPSFTDDPNYDSWTYEVFFRPGFLKGNFGLVYPNYRDRGEEWGYTCFYGKNPTFFTAEGKQSFNQAGYENYEFKNMQWYHIAGTFEPANNGLNRFKFYVNGELAFDVPTKGKTQGWQKAIIGNGSFNGWVRDFRIWNRALSQGEIKETMWSVRPDSEGLIMYLPLEKDFKNAIPGHEDDWIWQKSKSSNSYHFNDSFTFPMEMK